MIIKSKATVVCLEVDGRPPVSELRFVSSPCLIAELYMNSCFTLTFSNSRSQLCRPKSGVRLGEDESQFYGSAGLFSERRINV